MNTTADSIITVLGELMLVAFACRFGYLIFTAIKSGVARSPGREHIRTKTPAVFWFIVTAHSIFALMALSGGARLALKAGNLWLNKQ